MNPRTAPIPDETTEPIPKRFWWLKRIVPTVVLLLVIAAGVRWWWGMHATTLLRTEIEKYRAAGQPVFPEDFGTEPVPDNENSVVLLRRAVAALTLTDMQRTLVGDLSSNPRLIAQHRDEVTQIIAVSRDSLELAHQARSLPGVDWGIRRLDLDTSFQDRFSAHGELIQLLLVSAVDAHNGRHQSRALELLLDAIGASERVGKNSTMLGALIHQGALRRTALTIETIAPTILLESTPANEVNGASSRTGRQLGAVITALLDGRTVQSELVRTIYGERTNDLDCIRKVMGDPSYCGLRDTAGGTGDRGDATPWYPLGPMYTLDVVRMLRHTTQRAQAAGAPNWPSAEQFLPPPRDRPRGLKGLTRGLSMLRIPSFFSGVGDLYHTLAASRMAAIALAIRQFELATGNRPESLDMLVPEYLPRVPIDPFAADGSPIRYRPVQKPPVQYSVGPDGADDAGQYILDEQGEVDHKARDIPFFLNGNRPVPPPRTK